VPNGEAERAEFVRIVVGLKLHVTEERAIAAEAAGEAELFRQGHDGDLATDGHR
jgi:hypothetical protein